MQGVEPRQIQCNNIDSLSKHKAKLCYLFFTNIETHTKVETDAREVAQVISCPILAKPCLSMGQTTNSDLQALLKQSEIVVNYKEEPTIKNTIYLGMASQ